MLHMAAHIPGSRWRANGSSRLDPLGSTMTKATDFTNDRCVLLTCAAHGVWTSKNVDTCTCTCVVVYTVHALTMFNDYTIMQFPF